MDEFDCKGAKARVVGLAKFNKLLQMNVLELDDVSNRLETLQYQLCSFLKKGNSNEQREAARAVSLLTVSLGMEVPSLITTFAPLLKTLVELPKVNATTQGAAFEALSMLYFVVCEDEKVSLAAMARILDSCDGKQALNQGLCAGLNAWTLIASAATTRSVMELKDGVVPLLHGLLSYPELAVRVAAGEALGFVYGADIEDETYDDASDDDTLDDEVSADVHATVKKLANESSKSVAKKERAAQRAQFRAILKTIEQGELPEESLVICGTQQHTFRGWKQVKQLAALRAVLASGLKHHFRHNSLLAEIFDITIASAAAASGGDIDVSGSGPSKLERNKQSQLRKRNEYELRNKKRKQKNSFKSGGDDDD
jgi:hypothetical protein